MDQQHQTRQQHPVTIAAPPQDLGPPDGAPKTSPPPPPIDAANRSTSKVRKSWLVVVIAIAVSAVVAAVVMTVRYQSAAADRDDAERSVARTAQALVVSENRVAAAEVSLAKSEDILDGMEERLAETEADRADSEALVDAYRESTADFLSASMGVAIEVTEDEAKCLADALVESRGPEVLGLLAGASPSGFDEFSVELISHASDCGVGPDSFDPLAGSEYGDDPTLDALYDQCASGIGASCDLLYEQSMAGTGYEAFALTCGGRFELEAAPVLCEDSI